MDDYVSKPVRGEELAAAIRRRLGGGEPTTQRADNDGGPSACAAFDRSILLERLLGAENLCEEILAKVRSERVFKDSEPNPHALSRIHRQ